MPEQNMSNQASKIDYQYKSSDSNRNYFLALLPCEWKSIRVPPGSSDAVKTFGQAQICMYDMLETYIYRQRETERERERERERDREGEERER